MVGRDQFPADYVGFGGDRWPDVVGDEAEPAVTPLRAPGVQDLDRPSRLVIADRQDSVGVDVGFFDAIVDVAGAKRVELVADVQHHCDGDPLFEVALDCGNVVRHDAEVADLEVGCLLDDACGRCGVALIFRVGEGVPGCATGVSQKSEPVAEEDAGLFATVVAGPAEEEGVGLVEDEGRAELAVGLVEVHPAVDVFGGEVGHQAVGVDPGYAGVEAALAARRGYVFGQVYLGWAFAVTDQSRDGRGGDQAVMGKVAGAAGAGHWAAAS